MVAPEEFMPYRKMQGHCTWVDHLVRNCTILEKQSSLLYATQSNDLLKAVSEKKKKKDGRLYISIKQILVQDYLLWNVNKNKD